MRRILVTGANKGIGLAIVSEILDRHDDTFVFLGSRDPERGRAARERLAQTRSGWAERVEVLEIDVSSDESVSGAAQRVAARLDGEATPLHAIVNNAGVGFGNSELEAVLQVNTLGVRRVCEAFLPMLDPNAGRIANVTSAAGPNFVNNCSPERQRFFLDAKAEWPQLQAFIDECLGIDGAEAFAAAGLGDGNAYGLSKACANTYTLMLARENPGLKVNACTPGFIETDLTRPHAESRGKTPKEMGMKSPAEGTASALFLLFGDPEGNGHYYGSDAKRSPLDRYRAPGTEPYTGES